ncbi:MAG: SDR family oxidoreductase [Flavobacteriales bacterium]|nr:SDR family oxidoreductase [Flavobacteriales bacterium]MDG1766598.1 SDR family oxidoreductase [Flavobacteriales bacterium]
MKTSQKVVLVTGGSSGIGQAIAQYLSEHGHLVYATSRNPAQEMLGKVHMISMDVCDPNSVSNALKIIQSEAGKLDVLVNNAGLGMAGPLESTSQEEAEEIFSTNVFGVLNVCRAAVPLMRNGGGHIINITSIGGRFGLPYRGIYCSSKFAVAGLSETLSMELRQFGIRVCILEPGDFKTNINNNRKVAKAVDHEVYPRFKQALEQVNHEVSSAQDPVLIAKQIEKIIFKRKPRLYYQVATPTQRLSVFLKRILPGRLFERLIMTHYNMK